MKRIGIITIWQINNYGAELQAYALQRKLNDLGFDCENIDYPLYKNQDFRMTPDNRTPFPIGWKNHLKELIFPLLLKFGEQFHRSKCRHRAQKFTRFYQLTRHSARRYHSMPELYHDGADQYDVYIVGSDQVWNPRTPVSLAPYFLTFAPKTARKISYASSFGIGEIPKKYFPQYQKWFENLDSISVRETSGIKLVKQISMRDATHVLDPTLLLTAEEWQSLAVQPAETRPYVLLYDLIRSPETVKLAQRIARETKCRILRICRSAVTEKIAGIENMADAGPAEFLGLFMQASFVVTNSFHGTVFSIIFQKHFYSVIPRKMHNSARLHSLLKQLGLSDRLIAAEYVNGMENEGKLNFSECQSRLAQARAESLNFLTRSIQKDDHE